MEEIQSLLVGVVVFLLGVLCLRSRRYARMPPGPVSLPIIGSILSLRGDDVRESMLRLRDKYGDVFTVTLGQTDHLVLASFDAIKEAYVKYSHVFSDRPDSDFLFVEFFNNRGFANPKGRVWKELRRFTHGVFREFGVGKPVYEEKIQEEITHMMEVVKQNRGKPYDMSELLSMAISNVTNNVIFGHRYNYDDPDFQAYLNSVKLTLILLGNGGLLSIFPFLRHLPGDFFGYKNFRKTLDFQLDGFRKRIEEHKQTHTKGEVNDYIDAYLEETVRQENHEQSTFTDDELLYTVNALFAAGSETTATTLSWAFVYMLRQPDIHRRVLQEIDEVLGARLPSIRDKATMPFTDAVILETQRMGDILPLGSPHTTSQAVEFRGYHIPAGITVMPLMYAVHRDPGIWKDPYTFNPDRFLGEEGRINTDERLIPFSMGKRSCIGESLARMELFLFFTTVMQQINFKLPPGKQVPSEKSLVGVTNRPICPVELVMELRNVDCTWNG